ncbi:MAG: hypothetical protein HY535_04895 [Chloroflexi bacterium]|nr:hypothetical protein [Chloroflexota bacterium]
MREEGTLQTGSLMAKSSVIHGGEEMTLYFLGVLSWPVERRGTLLAFVPACAAPFALVDLGSQGPQAVKGALSRGGMAWYG